MVFVTRYWHLSLKSIATYTVYAIVRRSGDVLAAQCKCAAEGGGMQPCCCPAVLCTLRTSREVKSIKESSFNLKISEWLGSISVICVLETTLADRLRSQIRRFDPNPGVLIIDE